MNSLALEKKESDNKPCEPCCPDEPSYPCLTLRENQVEAFLDGMRLQPGAVYEATIRFKVDGFSNRYGKSLDLGVIESGELVEVSGAKAPKDEEYDEGEDEEGEGAGDAVMAVIRG